MGGQPRNQTDSEGGPKHAALEAFVEQVARLTDEDRLPLAEGREAVIEAYHAKALRAAADALAGRGEDYVRARARLATAHVPAKLADEDAESLDDEEAARWNEVARLVQQAVDDALLAVLARDKLHPNHLRELYRPWRAVADPNSR